MQQATVCEAVRKRGFKAMLRAILSASRPRTRALTAEKTKNAGEEVNKADNLLQNMREKRHRTHSHPNNINFSIPRQECIFLYNFVFDSYFRNEEHMTEVSILFIVLKCH